MGIEALLKHSLDSLSAKPLYAQLAAQIESLIQTGGLKAGELLPSEPELCEQLGISRSTVRLALAHLEEGGFVVRRRGKGTYVKSPKLLRTLSRLCSFTQQMTDLGVKSTSKLLDFALLDEDDGELPAEFSCKTYKIVRLRMADGQPFMIDTAFVPAYIAPSLTKEALNGRSLYDVVEEMTGHTPYRAHETYEATKLSDEELRLLETESRAAFLVKRISKMKSGALFEMASMLIRGDRCRLTATLQSDAVAFSRQFQR
jgi:GntR family transcriptional regulator